MSEYKTKSILDQLDEDEKSATSGNLVCTRSQIRVLIDIAKAAETAMNTIERVYSGVPGKLDWPGYHALKQALARLGDEFQEVEVDCD